MDDWMAEQLANAEEEGRDRLSAIFEGLPLVESFPAFSALMEDPLGYLWIQHYRLPSEDRVVWSVFDPNGRIMGVIETPRTGEVLEIGANHLLTLHTDDLDVEHVRMWRLDRNTTSTGS